MEPRIGRPVCNGDRITPGEPFFCAFGEDTPIIIARLQSEGIDALHSGREPEEIIASGSIIFHIICIHICHRMPGKRIGRSHQSRRRLRFIECHAQIKLFSALQKGKEQSVCRQSIAADAQIFRQDQPVFQRHGNGIIECFICDCKFIVSGFHQVIHNDRECGTFELIKIAHDGKIRTCPASEIEYKPEFRFDGHFIQQIHSAADSHHTAECHFFVRRKISAGKDLCIHDSCPGYCKVTVHIGCGHDRSVHRSNAGILSDHGIKNQIFFDAELTGYQVQSTCFPLDHISGHHTDQRMRRAALCIMIGLCSGTHDQVCGRPLFLFKMQIPAAFHRHSRNTCGVVHIYCAAAADHHFLK